MGEYHVGFRSAYAARFIVFAKFFSEEDAARYAAERNAKTGYEENNPEKMTVRRAWADAASWDYVTT